MILITIFPLSLFPLQHSALPLNMETLSRSEEANLPPGVLTQYKMSTLNTKTGVQRAHKLNNKWQRTNKGEQSLQLDGRD